MMEMQLVLAMAPKRFQLERMLAILSHIPRYLRFQVLNNCSLIASLRQMSPAFILASAWLSAWAICSPVCATNMRVFTLRCTAKLLRRLNARPEAVAVPPSTRLGDWYAHLLSTRPSQLVLCVSERTLLPVLIPAREAETLLPRFREAAREMLQAVGVPTEAVQDEDLAMATAAFGKTSSRRVLGSMNDFARMCDAYLEDRASWLDLSLRLADTPCSPLQMESPRRATLQLFHTWPDRR
jgi:hypothetical protein